MIANVAATPSASDARFTRGGIGRGFRQAAPLGLGAVAFGAAFGILAQNSGIGGSGAVLDALLSALLMSILVYSGTAQMVGLELWSSQASMLAIWGATALVSIRYVLLGLTMRDWFPGLPGWVVYPTLFLTADQSWALTHAEMNGGTRDSGFFLGSNLALSAGWIGGTALGVLAGGYIPNPSAWGLEFAATAAFIAILAGTYRGRGDIVPWLVAAGVALTIERTMPGQWFVVAGAVSGSVVGAIRHGSGHGA